jgi:hypothetical protein
MALSKAERDARTAVRTTQALINDGDGSGVRWAAAKTQRRLAAIRKTVQSALYPHLNSVTTLADHLERAARTIRAYAIETLKATDNKRDGIAPDGFKKWDRERVLGYVNESRALLDLIEQEATAE